MEVLFFPSTCQGVQRGGGLSEPGFGPGYLPRRQRPHPRRYDRLGSTHKQQRFRRYAGHQRLPRSRAQVRKRKSLLILWEEDEEAAEEEKSVNPMGGG